METTKRNELIFVIVAVVIVIAGVALFFYFRPDLKTPQTGVPSGQANQGENAGSLTKTEVPKDITVPDAGGKAAADVAIPTAVSSAAPGVSAKLRVFDIKASGDLYNPSTVIVKVGDTVHINFTAVDKIYDITFPDYGMKQVADRGQTKVLEFQAVTTGKFTYYCALCGGLDSKTIGYIIVAP